MLYGTQVSGERTTKTDAEQQAAALALQDGCIRVGVKWHPCSFAYPTTKDHYAYGVFADDCGEGAMPDGMRRVILVGRDERNAWARRLLGY